MVAPAAEVSLILDPSRVLLSSAVCTQPAACRAEGPLEEPAQPETGPKHILKR